MSDTLATAYNVAKAVTFNAQVAHKLGWYGLIPPGAIADFPDLSCDALAQDSGEPEAFADAVLSFQLNHLPNSADADGMLGRQTWAMMLKVYEYISSAKNYLVYKGRRLEFSRELPTYKVVNFDEKVGLDLHRGGDFTSWKKLGDGCTKKRIVLHWGGHSAKSCYNALMNRDLSSTAGIELGVAWQWLDAAHKGWHAGWGNHQSIGIDICQQPTIENLDRYRTRGLDVHIVENRTGRGERQVLTLDPQTAATVRAFCEDLCDTLGIPFRVPRGAHGTSSTGEHFHWVMSRDQVEDYEGILAHHHLSKQKWDIACWMEQIFGA